MSEAILQKLLVSFKAEQRDHLDRIRGLLQGLAGAAGEAPGPALEEAFRRAHSLKGAARAVDLLPVEKLAHGLETVLSRVRDGRLAFDERTHRTVQALLDAVEDWVVCYFHKQPLPAPGAALDALRVLLEAESPGAAPVPAAAPAPGAAPPEPVAAAATDEALRISARSMEQLMWASNRLTTRLAAQEPLAAKLRALEQGMIGLDQERERAGRTYRRAFDRMGQPGPLAPLRGHLELVDRQVRALRRQARELRSDHGRAAWELKAASTRLEEEVLRARMVPAESVLQGLRKMVRDLARDEGKEVELATEGLGVQADRLVLQALKDPVMHLLRNAVSHGLEPAAERRTAGKPATGTIRLGLQTQGNQLRVSVGDDGRGVDWEAVSAQAVRRRLLTAEQAARATGEELSRLLFLPGFSTARMVTDLSGRGMGMSVVSEAVKRLQGRVSVASAPGAGMTTEIVVPLSISSHRVLILECAGQRFALPVLALERLVQVPVAKMATLEGKPVVVIGDRTVRLASLAALLGLADVPLKVERDRLAVALLKTPGGGVMGVAADAFVTEVEAVVKSIRGGAERAASFSGAILTGDGRVVLMLDAEALIQRGHTLEQGPVVRAEAAPPPPRQPTILVVDDSVTTRTLEKSILDAHGYQVRLAVDGEEALQRLRADQPDLAIVDVQMPRMDGFQLIEHMKADAKLAKIPVIIVTSLESREDKERGMALGADAYIVKRKFDHKGLLDAIRQIL